MPFFDHPLAQAIGLLGFGVSITAMLQKNDRRMKLLLALMASILALHFWLLGAVTAAWMVTIGASRFALSLHPKAKKFTLPYLLAYALLGTITYSEWVDLLPIASGIIATYSVFYLSAIRMRAFLLTGSCLWLIHNIVQGSIGGVLMEIAFISANCFTIKRLRAERHV